MNATTKVKLKDITPNLTCPLCRGYFVDATTIIECLHSFCKSCIVTHLERSEYCPVCDVQLHSSKPLSSIRSDQMLQEVVYKLVPGLFQNEMERRRKFYKEHPDSKPISQLDSGQVFNESYITSDDSIYLSLECQTTNAQVLDSTKRYIRCPAAVSIGILKSLLQNKYDLSREATIDIMYGERILPDDFLMMDIAYKYSWTPNGKHLPLSFRVKGSPSLFKPIQPPPKVDRVETEVENKPLVEKQKGGFVRRKSLSTKQPSETPPTPKPLSNGKLQNKQNGGITTPNTQIPVRGRRKKKSMDTEKELSKLRAAATAIESKEKEVQLRISENGVMSARNVASGEEKIIGNKSTVKNPPPPSPNGVKPSHLILPQIVPAISTAKTPKLSLIPKLNQSPKPKPSASIASSNKSTKTPKEPKKATKPKPNLGRPSSKLSKNSDLKAISLKIHEELEATIHYFAAEITPINGTPPPKNPQPKEGQKYPAATLHTTDLTSKTTQIQKPAVQSLPPTSLAYNKRLQTTIINGDVKFTKNLLASPVKTVPKGRDSPVQPTLASPTGSPSKTPKFFKSRHVEVLSPQIAPELLPKIIPPPPPPNITNFPITSTNSSTVSSSSTIPPPSFNSSSSHSNGHTQIHDRFHKTNTNNGLTKIEPENPAKKVKLDHLASTSSASGPTLSLVTGTVTVPSLGGSTVSSTGQPPTSFRYPVNFPNGIPMNLVPFITSSLNSYASPFLNNNPNLKNMPIFTHPYLGNLGFSTQSQIFTPTTTTFSQGFNNTLILPGPSSNIAPKKSTEPLKNPPLKKLEELKVSTQSTKADPEDKTSKDKLPQKPDLEEHLSKTQGLLAKIHQLGSGAVNFGSANGKNPRKSMSPAKISRSGTSNANNNASSSSSSSNGPTSSEKPTVPDSSSSSSSNHSETKTSPPPDSSNSRNSNKNGPGPESSPKKDGNSPEPSKMTDLQKIDSNVNNNDQHTNKNLVSPNNNSNKEASTTGVESEVSSTTVKEATSSSSA